MEALAVCLIGGFQGFREVSTRVGKGLKLLASHETRLCPSFDLGLATLDISSLSFDSLLTWI